MYKFMLTVLSLWTLAATADTAVYEHSSHGTRWLESKDSGISLKVLVEQANLGGSEVEVGEIRFPAGYESRAHVHEVEIFYVLEGKLFHKVNDDEQILTPGMIGIVRAPDEVVHKAVDGAVTAIVIWPGSGEVQGLSRVWDERALTEMP
ncbi:MAG: cupin domain-containing protein [Woeseiaceae bacterium]|nr:cupin domain-containing protein [Woeseiaceae bacterium]